MNIVKIDINGFYVSHRVGDEFSTWGSDELRDCLLPAGDSACYKYENGAWIGYAAMPAVVPTEIRMAQCRAQLIIDGKDDDVELLLAGITDPIQQKLYRSFWEYETVVKRDNVMINEMAPALAIDLDAFFIAASKL